MHISEKKRVLWPVLIHAGQNLLKMERNRDEIIKMEPHFQIKTELSDVDLLYLDYTSINPRLNEDQLSREIKSEPWIEFGDYMNTQTSTITEEIDVPSLKRIKPKMERYTDSPALVSDRDVLMLDYKPILPGYQPSSFENSTINIQSENSTINIQNENSTINIQNENSNINTQNENRFVFPFDLEHGGTFDSTTPVKDRTSESQVGINGKMSRKRETLSSGVYQTFVNKENSHLSPGISTRMLLHIKQPLDQFTGRRDCCCDRTFSSDEHTKPARKTILSSVDTQINTNDNILPRVCFDYAKHVHTNLRDTEILNHPKCARQFSSGIDNDADRRILAILAQAVKEQDNNAGRQKSSKNSSDVEHVSNGHQIFTDIRRVKTYARDPKGHSDISSQPNLDGAQVAGSTDGFNDSDFRAKPNHYSSDIPICHIETPISVHSERVDASEENRKGNVYHHSNLIDLTKDRVGDSYAAGFPISNQSDRHNPSHQHTTVERPHGWSDVVYPQQHSTRHNNSLSTIRSDTNQRRVSSNTLNKIHVHNQTSAELSFKALAGLNSLNSTRDTTLDVQVIRGDNSQQKRKSAALAMDKLSQLGDDVIDDDTDPSYIGDVSVSPSTAKSKSSNGPYRDLSRPTERLHARAMQNYHFHKIQTQPELCNYIQRNNVINSTCQNSWSRNGTANELLKMKRSAPGKLDNSITKRHCPNYIQAILNVGHSSDKGPTMVDTPTSARNQEHITPLVRTDLQGQISAKQSVNSPEVLQLRGDNSRSSNTNNCFDGTEFKDCNSSDMPNEIFDLQNNLQSNNLCIQNPTSAGVSVIAIGRVNFLNITRDTTPAFPEIKGHNSTEHMGRNTIEIVQKHSISSDLNSSRPFQNAKSKTRSKTTGRWRFSKTMIRMLIEDDDVLGTYNHKEKEPEPKLRCAFCERSFVSDYHLNRHIGIFHTTDRTVICEVCGKKFGNLQTFLIHMSNHDKRFTCDICNTQWSTTYNLKTHMLSHTGEKPHKCELCEKSFSRLDNLVLHLKLMHKDVDVLPYNCKECPEKFKTWKDKKDHFTSVHGLKKYKPVTCDLCGMQSSSRKSVPPTHLKHHEQGRVFTCQLCNKSCLLTSRKNIACDIKEGDNITKSCFSCFKNWAKKTHSLYMAGLLITDAMKTVQCKICQRKFFEPRCMKEHMWKIHSIRHEET